MPSGGQQIVLQAPRLDGGRSIKDSPAEIAINESPDTLNTTFDDRGAVQTRFGSTYFNTSVIETGSFAIDGIATYNGSLIVWAGGSMYRASGTTFVTIASAQSVYTSGAKVAHTVYLGMLISSEGTNGPFRYHDSNAFYRLGIAIPSAPTGASNVTTVAGGGPEPGTYYYALSYANTSVVEGEIGSQSVGVVNTNTSVVNVTSIPTGSASLGVATRYIYRASITGGPFRRVGTLGNNTASIFTDTMSAATWTVQTRDVIDATAPTPFTTVKLHKEHLWFPDNTNRNLLRFTNFGVPYISEAENFIPLDRGDGSDITAIGVQDDFVCAFKSESIWITDVVQPGSPETYQTIKSPSNLGIVGSRAFRETENGILFVGRTNQRITGFHILAGTQVAQTSDSKMRTQSVSEKLEPEILDFPSAGWADIATTEFENAIYIACRFLGDTQNAHIYWFDKNRLGSQGQPGSWSLWDGIDSKVNCFAVHNGELYSGSSTSDGRVYKMSVADRYKQADDSAINSYWWSKQIGGDEGLDSWFKDWRRLNVWFSQLGNWYMNIRYRRDGDTGDGSYQSINLTPGGGLFDSATFDFSTFTGAADTEAQLSFGAFLSRRVSVRFDNQNTINQGFKVYKFNVFGTLRRVY